jgi:hypothetical protein
MTPTHCDKNPLKEITLRTKEKQFLQGRRYMYMSISINILACLECSCHIWISQLVYFDKIHHVYFSIFLTFLKCGKRLICGVGSHTVNREMFATLKVGKFAFFQLAVDKIPCLLHKLNGQCIRLEIFTCLKFAFDSAFAKIKCSQNFTVYNIHTEDEEGRHHHWHHVLSCHVTTSSKGVFLMSLRGSWGPGWKHAIALVNLVPRSHTGIL